MQRRNYLHFHVLVYGQGICQVANISRDAPIFLQYKYLWVKSYFQSDLTSKVMFVEKAPNHWPDVPSRGTVPLMLEQGKIVPQ